MSDAAGTDNPAFASEDECGSKTENGGQQQQVTSDQDRKSSSADCAPVENGQRSFISQHYVEPVKARSEPCYKTETRIELPAENTEKSVPEPKLNGVHGNGNNNDASFLNNSTTSVQVNERETRDVPCKTDADAHCTSQRNTREQEAISYLKEKRIRDIIDFLMSNLLIRRPYDPFEYLTQLLDRCILSRDGLVDSPSSFSLRDIIRQAEQSHR